MSCFNKAICHMTCSHPHMNGGVQRARSALEGQVTLGNNIARRTTPFWDPTKCSISFQPLFYIFK